MQTEQNPAALVKRRAPPVLELVPLQLTAKQEAVLRLDALQRVLDADATPAQHLRASLLTSLATRCVFSQTLVTGLEITGVKL